MTFFGWTIHRGPCECQRIHEGKESHDAWLRERKQADFYELLFRRESKKVAHQHTLGLRIAAQRRQIRRLKALVTK